MLVLFAVGFVFVIVGILVVIVGILVVVRILVLMGLHSLDRFLGNGVDAVHQRDDFFVRGIDGIENRFHPGIGIAADVDEEIAFGNCDHIARCRLK